MQVPLLGFALLVIGLRRDFAMLVFVSPALFSAVFHASFTHYIPRYGMPLQSISAIAALDSALFLIRAGVVRLRRRGE